MERLSDRAIEIINELHRERLDYDSEYLPLIDCANKCQCYEDTGLEPEEIQVLKVDAANGQQMKNLLSRNGFRDLSEAQAWIEQMKKLESNIEYYGKAYETPFCPAYGAPMTDEAVEITMRRLEALNEED